VTRHNLIASVVGLPSVLLDGANWHLYRSGGGLLEVKTTGESDSALRNRSPPGKDGRALRFFLMAAEHFARFRDAVSNNSSVRQFLGHQLINSMEGQVKNVLPSTGADTATAKEEEPK